MFWAWSYAAWGVILFFASSLEGLPGPAISHIDKVEHALFFAAGHLALGLALTIGTPLPTRQTWRRIGVLLVIVAGVVGVLDEFHQSFTPHRTGNDPGDIAADITGGIIAALALPKAWRILQRFKMSEQSS